MALLQGCALLRPPLSFREEDFRSRPVPGLPVTLRYLPVDAPVISRMEKTIREGAARAARWGSFRDPVAVVILPDHRALERAARKRGYPWLKAWATEKEILVQSPRSWPLVRSRNLSDLMAHEMTHVVHYQVAGIRASRSRKNDPFWFREGLASWTANQAYRRYSKGALLRRLRGHPDFAPLAPTAEQIQERPKLAYSAAHYLVAYLIETRGEEAIRDLLGRMGRGESFDEAFEGTYGITPWRLPGIWLAWLSE